MPRLLWILWCAIALFPLGLLVWQLVTGCVYTRSGRVWSTRRQRPRLYWGLIAAQGLLVLAFWGWVLYLVARGR